MFKFRSCLFVGLVVLLLSPVQATPIMYVDNGHYYEVITLDESLTWESAKSAAEALGGHLATIADSDENDFVAALVGDAQGSLNSYWLGGYQPPPIDPADEPANGWAWVTGEAWSFSNWASGEPNNGRGGIQHYLHYWPSLPYWDDQDFQQHMVGYVVEYNTNPSLTVPEPSITFLFAVGLLGLSFIRSRARIS